MIMSHLAADRFAIMVNEANDFFEFRENIVPLFRFPQNRLEAIEILLSFLVEFQEALIVFLIAERPSPVSFRGVEVIDMFSIAWETVWINHRIGIRFFA